MLRTARQLEKQPHHIQACINNPYSVLQLKYHNTPGFTQKDQTSHEVSYIQIEGAGTESLKGLAPAWWILLSQRLALEKWLTTAPI